MIFNYIIIFNLFNEECRTFESCPWGQVRMWGGVVFWSRSGRKMSCSTAACTWATMMSEDSPISIILLEERSVLFWTLYFWNLIHSVRNSFLALKNIIFYRNIYFLIIKHYFLDSKWFDVCRYDFFEAKIILKLENNARKKSDFLNDILKHKLSLFESKHYFNKKWLFSGIIFQL